MKKSLITLALMALCVPMFAQTPAPADNPPAKTKTSKPKKAKKAKKAKKGADSATPAK